MGCGVVGERQREREKEPVSANWKDGKLLRQRAAAKTISVEGSYESDIYLMYFSPSKHVGRRAFLQLAAECEPSPLVPDEGSAWHPLKRQSSQSVR